MASCVIGPKFYGIGTNGLPLPFGKLYTYDANTNNPRPTYNDEDGTTVNPNPVILSGEGYADVYLSGSYRLVLKDQYDSEIWSQDKVTEATLGGGGGGGGGFTIYETVADMVAASIDAGEAVRTGGYHSAGDGGGAFYAIVTAAQFGGTPDEYGDHTIANGNIAVLQSDNILTAQYGCRADGTTNDYNSFNAAIQAGAGSGKTVVVQNNGILLVENTVAVTVSDSSLHIVGSGPTGSKIRSEIVFGFQPNPELLFITQGGDRSNVTIENLEFIAAEASGSFVAEQFPPIYCYLDPTDTKSDRQITVRDVTFTSDYEYDPLRDGSFFECVTCDNSRNITVENCRAVGTGAPATNGDHGIGFMFKNCSNVNVQDCYGYYMTTGVYIQSDATYSAGENITIANSLFDNVNEGVRAGDDSHANHGMNLSVIGCKFATRISEAFRVENFYGIKFMGNMCDKFRQTSSSNNSLHFRGCRLITIDNNEIHASSGATANSFSEIYLWKASGSLTSGQVFIRNNMITTPCTNGIYVDFGGDPADTLFIQNNWITNATTVINPNASTDYTYTASGVEGIGAGFLQTEDNSTNYGPEMTLRRRQPWASSDKIGRILYDGVNDSATQLTYAGIAGESIVATASAERGAVSIQTRGSSGGLEEVGKLDNADTASNTALLLLVNDGTVTSVRRVSVGAADSESVGFRALRVPN